jgi:DNA-binding NtrC family response regulator
MHTKTDAAKDHTGGLVCVIDDDASVRNTVCMMLDRAGYETVQASDGEIGMKLVAERNPSVVVTDLIMPNQEGIETIQLLKERFPKLPVLAISGSFNAGTVDYLELARCMGANEVLAKPFKSAQLLEKIEALFALRQ